MSETNQNPEPRCTCVCIDAQDADFDSSQCFLHGTRAGAAFLKNKRQTEWESRRDAASEALRAAEKALQEWAKMTYIPSLIRDYNGLQEARAQGLLLQARLMFEEESRVHALREVEYQHWIKPPATDQ